MVDVRDQSHIAKGRSRHEAVMLTSVGVDSMAQACQHSCFEQIDERRRVDCEDGDRHRRQWQGGAGSS
jgi:hypothetical protein